MAQNFDWPDLFPELQHFIRTEHLDDVGRQMMRWTCKAEQECVPSTRSPTAFLDLFEAAAEEGHENVCRWLFNASQSWWLSPRLPYGACLHGSHYALAEWAYGVGLLPGRRNIGEFMKRGNLTALQWVVKKHGTPSTPWAVDAPITTLAVVQWLYTTGVGCPTRNGVICTLSRLPASSAVLEFINAPWVYCEWALNFANRGDWTVLDFIRRAYPSDYLRLLEINTMLGELHEARRSVPEGHELDLKTGEITPIDCSDMPELEMVGESVDRRLSETPEVW